MLRDEAQRLQEGDETCSPDDIPAWRPRRITEIHVSPVTGFVRVRIATTGSVTWRPVDGFIRVPEGAHYDQRHTRWLRNGIDCTPKRSDVKFDEALSWESDEGQSEAAGHPQGDEQD